MKTATRYLEKHMVGDLGRVTGGRYRRVRVDDKTLDIEVHAPEKGDWVPASSLSQGTLDLVYLVARLGLVRLVTGDRRPPLIFDDPFVTLDDARATRALELLKRDRRGLPGHLPDDVDRATTRRPTRSSSSPGRPASIDGVDGVAEAVEPIAPVRRPGSRTSGRPDRPRRGGARDDRPRSACRRSRGARATSVAAC